MNETFYKVRAKAHFFKMGAAYVNLGQNVFIPQMFAMRVGIVHYAVYLEVGNHFINIVQYNEGVRFISITASASW
jgi:hypothetical protein